MVVREEEKLYRERERNHGVRNRATICFTSSRLSKLKSEGMRINSNAMFFGRASLGMKKSYQ